LLYLPLLLPMPMMDDAVVAVVVAANDVRGGMNISGTKSALAVAYAAGGVAT